MLSFLNLQHLNLAGCNLITKEGIELFPKNFDLDHYDMEEEDY